MTEPTRMSRRDVMRLALAAGIAPQFAFAEDSMITRPIPASGEALPVIGLGTWQVFDVAGTADEITSRRRIVQMLLDGGGSLIDTSPMYNRSEKVIGDVIDAGIDRRGLFLATKVWTDGRRAGEEQMDRSFELMNTDTIDLMQVHNRRDLEVHMTTIRERQQADRIRYNGVTDYRESAHDDMAGVIREHEPQFIQINYSLGEHAADDELLPLARDMGVAVLVNRPFMSGRLFRAVRGRALPEWSRDFAASWAQFFLKFIVSHPAVTCVIPATSDPGHMADNLGAGSGELPDAGTRRRMIELIGAL